MILQSSLSSSPKVKACIDEVIGGSSSGNGVRGIRGVVRCSGTTSNLLVRTTYRYHIGCYIFNIERRTESYSHAEIPYSNLSGVKTKSLKGINISYKPSSKYMHYSQSSSSLSSFLLMGDFFSSFGLPGARLVAPLTRS